MARIVWIKQPGDGQGLADDIAKNEDGIDYGAPVSMAIHTRGASVGSPDDNNNNHPVLYNKALVTHNGNVSNHDVIKRGYDKVPDVDSAALSIAISLSKKPKEDIRPTVFKISEMTGGAAFHGTWIDQPNLSFFGKFGTWPLAFVRNDDIFIYASEQRCIDAFMKIMGISDDLEVRTVDANTWFLLEKNVPIWWGKNVPISTALGKNTVTRIRPDLEPWVTSSSKDFFINDDLPWTAHSSVDNKFVKIVWDKGKTFNEDLKSFVESVFGLDFIGKGVASKMGTILAEADEVYAFDPLGTKGSPSSRTIYSAWLGKTEIVLTSSGIVRDMYNWDDEFVRFNTKPVNNGINAVALNPMETFEKFLAHWSSKYYTNVTPATPNGPWRDSGWNMVQMGSMNGHVTTQLGEFPGLNAGLHVPRPFFLLKTATPAGLPLITSTDCTKLYIDNHNHMVFMYDGTCPVHACKFSMHSNPRNCLYMRLYALATMDRFNSLTSMLVAYAKTNVVKAQTLAYSKDKCTTGHAWVSSDIVQMRVYGVQIDLAVEDTCSKCFAYRVLTRMPKWMKPFLTENDVILPHRTEDQLISRIMSDVSAGSDE